jgi:PKD repeat protein
MVITACLLIPGALAASATADQLNDQGTGGIPPAVNFSVDHSTINVGDTVQFKTPSGNNTTWSWNFGDASPLSTEQNPTHQYTTADTYTVTLRVQNDTGFHSESSGYLVPGGNGYTLPSIVVKSPSVDSVKPQYKISLNDAETGPYGTEAGNFPETVNVGDTLNFTDASLNSPNSWSWNFGEGALVTGTNVTKHTYNTAGVFTVYLTAGNSKGDVTSSSLNITVGSVTNPTSKFTATDNAQNGKTQSSSGGIDTVGTTVNLSGIATMDVKFTDTSIKSPKNWSWNFDYFNPSTAATSTLQNPTYSFPKGNHLVVLNTSNDRGAGTSASMWVNASGPSQPNADFTFTQYPANGFSDAKVQFNDTSAVSKDGLNAPTNWTWNFGDGSPVSHEQNATYTYSRSGSFTVTLQTRNNAADPSTVHAETLTVTAPVAPSARFSINGSPYNANNNGFVDGFFQTGATISFVNQSYGYPNVFSWTFSDGLNSSTSENGNRSFAKADNYWVDLKVTNAYGSHETRNYFVVSDAPKSNLPTDVTFTSNPSSGEVPQTVQFNGSANGNPTTYQWMINNVPQTETTQNLTRNFTASGSYTVILVAINAAGSTASDPQTITVTKPLGKPNASFTVTPKGTYAPADVQFTYDGGNATSFSWDFDDGTPLLNTTSPLHTFLKPGIYTVRLTTANEVGTNTLTKDVEITGFVSHAPTASFYANDRLVHDNMTVTMDKRIQNVTGDVINFTGVDTNTNNTWIWNFGDDTGSFYTQTVNHTYTKPGDYSVYLYVFNGLGADIKYAQFLVNITAPVEQANFTANTTSGFAPLAVQFNDTSKNSPIAWYWDFGDSTSNQPISDLQNPTHTFNIAGNHTVTLTTATGVPNDQGSANSLKTSTKSMVINVLAPIAPVSNFTATPMNGTAPLNVTFTDTSVNLPTSWNWSFGDGQFHNGTTANPTHEYKNRTGGNYTVSLTASNAQGTGTTFSQTIHISAAPIFTPVANFTANTTTGVTPLTVLFADNSTNADTWSWDFGDNTTASVKNPPAHTYTAVGLHTVNLTVVNTTSNTKDYASTTINVTAAPVKPVANFTATPLTGPAPLTVQFTSTSTNADSVSWDFGDGTPVANATTLTHTFQDIKNYNVTLTATNNAGNNVTTQVIQARALKTPVVSFTANGNAVSSSNAGTVHVSGQAPFKVSFNDTSSERPSAWYWSFGDNTAGDSNQNTTHTYTKEGQYSVYLVAANSAGSDYVYSQYLINVSAPAPKADFTYNQTSLVAPLNVQFTDKTGNSPFLWSWTFGDGSISGEQSPLHTYAKTGNYTVTLTAQNSVGITNTTQQVSVIAQDKPVASFTANQTTGPAPLTVQFTDTSSNSPTKWTWTFPDNSKSYLQNPQYTFTTVSPYSIVYLDVENGAGNDHTTKMFNITAPTPTTQPTTPQPTTQPTVVAAFTANTTSGAAPLTVQFTDKSTGADQWVWSFDNDPTGVRIQNPIYTFQTAGPHTVQLQAINSTTQKYNTTAPLTITVTAAPSTLQAAFNVNSQAVQIGQFVTTTDASTGYPATWSWDFGDGFLTSNQNANHAYSSPGLYNLTLKVTNGTQTSTANKTITVSTVPTTTTTTITPTQGHPYNGPHNAPGTVQAEDYDLGGQNVAYYDTTAGNAGGAYRSDDVDIEAGATGYAVAYVIGGEYLTYSVDAATAGDYTVSLSAANPDASTKQIQLTTLGNSATTVSVASTGSFDTYKTFTSAGTLHLGQGRNIVTVTFGASRMNLDYITFGSGVTPTTTVTTQPTTTVTTQPTTGAASFTVSPTSGRHSLSVALADTTTGGNPVSWKWNCGNGQTFSGQNIGLNRIWYNNAGTYTITLTVTDANSSTRTATQTVTVS